MATIAVLTMTVAELVWERKAIEHERLGLLEREHAARVEASGRVMPRTSFSRC